MKNQKIQIHSKIAVLIVAIILGIATIFLGLCQLPKRGCHSKGRRRPRSVGCEQSRAAWVCGLRVLYSSLDLWAGECTGVACICGMRVL